MYASRSPISGAWACTQHRRECVEHRDYVLPIEAVRCAISRQELCIQHTVETECGRRVAPVHAMRLADGRYGCSDHYVLCTQSHPVARAQAIHCPECRLPVCPDHVGADAYDPRSPRCATHLRPCSRCGLTATHREGAVCAWCASREPLDRTPEASRIFAEQVRPKLPWAQRMLHGEVRISGSDEVRIFQVSALLGVRLYRVTGDQVELKEGNAWKTV